MLPDYHPVLFLNIFLFLSQNTRLQTLFPITKKYFQVSSFKLTKTPYYQMTETFYFKNCEIETQITKLQTLFHIINIYSQVHKNI